MMSRVGMGLHQHVPEVGLAYIVTTEGLQGPETVVCFVQIAT